MHWSDLYLLHSYCLYCFFFQKRATSYTRTLNTISMYCTEYYCSQFTVIYLYKRCTRKSCKYKVQYSTVCTSAVL